MVSSIFDRLGCGTGDSFGIPLIFIQAVTHKSSGPLNEVAAFIFEHLP